MFTLEEVINGKNSFYAEIKDAAENKQKIALKIWLRIKNLEKSTGFNQPPGSNNPGTSYNGMVQNLVV